MEQSPRPGPVPGGRPAVPVVGRGPQVTADPQVPGVPTRDELLTRIAGLEHKMASLPEIEQAKGALMLTYGLTADAAFELLRFHSMNRNVKIRSLAATIAGLLPNVPTTTAATARFDRILAQAAHAWHTSLPTTAGGGPGSEEERTPLLSSRPGLADVTPSALDQDPFAASGPGVTIADSTGVRPFIYVNDAFTTLTGYPRDMILGRNCRFLQGPDTDPRDVDRLREALRSGTDVSVVLRNYRKDGSPFWNEVSISPLLGATGRITHWVGTQIEVTPA